MEITPDEIYFSITLKEYKEGGKVVAIDQLEEQLEKSVKASGIPKENFQVENIYGYN